MLMNKRIIIGIVILLLILLVECLVWKTTHYPNNTYKSSTHTIKPLPKEVTVTVTKNGFSPKEVTIEVGSAVRWTNKSGEPQTVNSDNYPTNQLHKELNFGEFANNSSVVYTFTKPGTYGYHNQFHHKQTGEIIVTK